MIKRPEQRVVVLIDTQNMYHSAKHLYGAHLNFKKLVETLVGDRQLVRAIAYVATSKTGEEKAFFGALTAGGIEVKSKDVIEFASGERKADWDVGITIDAVKHSDRTDCMILVTGDGDFVPLVEYLQGKGVITEVAAFSESTNKQLREVCDEYFDISDHPAELLMASGRNVARAEGRAEGQTEGAGRGARGAETKRPASKDSVTGSRDTGSHKSNEQRRPPQRPNDKGPRRVRVTT